MLPLEGEVARCVPEPEDDLQLLLEPVKPLARGGKGMPYAVYSCSYQPVPRPSSTRPPLIWSTWATVMARTPGSRKVPAVTSVPRRIRLVSRASPARVTQASVGPGSPSPPIAR